MNFHEDFEELFISQKSVTNFREPSDCTKYHLCVHGAVITQTCQPGLVFNEAIGACDWPAHVPECAGKLPHPVENQPPVPTAAPPQNYNYPAPTKSPIITIPPPPPMQMEGECKNRRPDELFRYFNEILRGKSWKSKGAETEIFRCLSVFFPLNF